MTGHLAKRGRSCGSASLAASRRDRDALARLRDDIQRAADDGFASAWLLRGTRPRPAPC
jgi:hypothetical protein